MPTETIDGFKEYFFINKGKKPAYLYLMAYLIILRLLCHFPSARRAVHLLFERKKTASADILFTNAESFKNSLI